MNIIKVLFDEIVSRLLMIVLSVLILLVGLWSPTRLMYALSTLNVKQSKKGCSSC